MLLSQVFGIAFNLLSFPFSTSEDGRSAPAFFPFDTLRNMREPCTSFTFRMGENELKFTALPRGYCANCCPLNMTRDVRFVLYNKENAESGLEIPLRSGAAREAGVDADRPTAIFVHGFTEVSPGQSGRAVVDAYLGRKEPKHNIILMDWSELCTFPWYQTAVENVPHAAERLQEFLQTFNSSGEIPAAGVHVIGFSLGSHVAGIAGKLLGDAIRIPRITALDPALPEFSMNDDGKRLSSSDADYVDVIHTDSGIFGFPISLGHADFYPNGGRALQPGCQPSYLVRQRIVDQVVACSHVRAWRLYAESVRYEKAFPATKCPIWRGPEKQCNFAIDAYMGYINNGKAKGSYYLITHESKPYGRRKKTQLS